MPVDKALASFTLQGGQLLLAPRMQITPLGRQGMGDPVWGVPLSLSR